MRRYLLALTLVACGGGSDDGDASGDVTSATDATSASDGTATEETAEDTEDDTVLGPVACSIGGPFLGNPTSDGACPAEEGQEYVGGNVCGLKATQFVPDGPDLLTTSATAVWRIGDGLTRVVGDDVGDEFAPTDCATGKFIAIRGITHLVDRHFVVADERGNSLVHLSFTTDCILEPIAGNRSSVMLADVSNTRPNHGDADGPLADALLDGPMWPVSAAAGVYFWDDGNHKVKLLGQSDVSTVFTAPSEWQVGSGGVSITALTVAGDKVVLALSNYPQDVAGSVALVEVDPSDGSFETLAAGVNSDWSGGLTSSRLDSITAAFDGVVAIDHGVLSYVSRTVNRGVIYRIAGDPAGGGLDYPNGYDPLVPHSTDELVLLTSPGYTSSFGANQFVSYTDGLLYVAGFPAGSGFTVALSCGAAF